MIAHDAEVEAERSDAGPETRRDVDAGDGVVKARGMGRQAGIDEAVDEPRLAIGFDAGASERHAAEDVFRLQPRPEGKIELGLELRAAAMRARQERRRRASSGRSRPAPSSAGSIVTRAFDSQTRTGPSPAMRVR